MDRKHQKFIKRRMVPEEHFNRAFRLVAELNEVEVDLVQNPNFRPNLRDLWVSCSSETRIRARTAQNLHQNR